MIRTLIVEDDALTAEAHAEYLARLPGFELAGVARTAGSALQALHRAASGERPPIDLVLLDMTLPDGHGIDLARRLRAGGHDVDIVAITAVRETDVVHAAVSVGIVQYLIKPFSFAAFRDRLGDYREYRKRVALGSPRATQAEVDGFLAAYRPRRTDETPKGLSAATLQLVSDHLRAFPGPGTALAVAAALQLSRVTARRYLEHLADTGQVIRSSRYGSPGRPELDYRWLGQGADT
ncbi:MAG: response regulator [Microbacteriaceae bacterium]|nr:response regulator [Microbacteriaceae bacterium]